MTDFCATNLSRGDHSTVSGPDSPTPTLCPFPTPASLLAGIFSAASEQNPALGPELIFLKPFLTAQGPKAQHGPLPRPFSQAGEQRRPRQVLQNHSMTARGREGEGGFPRKELQSQQREPTPRNGPVPPWEVGRESSSCRILEESSNWQRMRKEQGHEQINKNQWISLVNNQPRG